MQIIIKGKQMDVSPQLRQHIERKVQKLARLVSEDARVEVTVAEEQTRSARDRFSVQLMLISGTHPFRSEVSAANATIALDSVLDKVMAQLGRQKGRQVANRHHTGPLRVLALSRAGALTAVEEEQDHALNGRKQPASIAAAAASVASPLDEQQNEEIWSRVMEIRRVATRPMNDQEVIAYMETHSLDFYPFFNDATSSVNVMYRLHEGGYGLLVPAMEA